MSSLIPEEHQLRVFQVAFVVLVVSLAYSLFVRGGLVAWVVFVSDVTVAAITLWLLYRFVVAFERIAGAFERIAGAQERRQPRDEFDRENRPE